MPPKKPAKTTIIGEYDIELMNEQELRLYVSALQEEHQRMRKARNLYQEDKRELLSLLKSVQEDAIDKEGIEIQKNFAIQELIKHAEQESKFEDSLSKIKELEKSYEDEECMLDFFTNIKFAEILNREEEDALVKAIAEKDREIQRMEFMLPLIPIDLKENSFEKHLKSSQIRKSDFEKTVTHFNENLVKATEEFSNDKSSKLQAIWGGIPVFNYSFSSDVAKMSAYFNEIYLKNVKTIEELQLTLNNLEKELHTIKLNLLDIIEENNGLRTYRGKPVSPKPSPTTSTSSGKSQEQELEELTYDNYLLTLKLDMLKKVYSDLKEKFVFNLRKIHQKADFKALLLEQKLLSLETLLEGSRTIK